MDNRISLHNIPKPFTRLAVSVALATFSAAALTDVDIASAPLQTGATVEPNILFILDDSGSMNWELMPESLRKEVGQSYLRNVDFDDSNHKAIRARSPENTVYYNPEIDYQPWAKADGTSYPNTPATAAYTDPNSGNTTNLTQQSNGDWRITYYILKSGALDKTSPSNYYKYQYRNGALYRTDLGTNNSQTLTSVTWSGGKTRTATEEINNFANWYSYYRKRLMAAKAASSIAFNELGKDYRVGFDTINNTYNNNMVLEIPTSGKFEGSQRTNWFNALLSVSTNGSTPLRRSLDKAGRYFKGELNSDPMSSDPVAVSCRQNFAILTTDGAWNGSAPSNLGNQDNSSGDVIYDPNGNSFTYTPERPYSDSHSDTLADVAMKYWKQDLRPNLANNVPTSSGDPAFWQHMTTFGLSLGLMGNYSQDDLPDLISGSKSWLSPHGNEEDPVYAKRKIDDLFHATVNGRGTFVAARDPLEFANGLKAALGNIGERVASASNLAGNSTSLTTNSAVYQARFVSGKWTGDLWSYPITNGVLGTTPTWKASEQLPVPAQRNILSWNDSTSQAVAFLYDNLSTAQKGDQGLGSADVVNYLRGDQSNELSNGGTFRNRTSVLGDIVNSSPHYIGATENRRYERFAWSGASAYKAFRQAQSNRTGMVYVGANDGMLHGFDAATGEEKLAYLPSFLFSQAKELTDPDYNHRYLMDGQISSGDAYISTPRDSTTVKWRTILVASPGRGGKGLVAIDVTDPTTLGANQVMWEFTDPDLGYTLSQPVIMRLDNGQWAVAIGNGYNSANQRSVLFLINLATGSLIKKFDTENGDSTNTNGMSSPVGWDSDRDGNIELLFAGDLRGNVWKFNVSGSNTGQWSSAFTSGNGNNVVPAPLFIAQDPAGKRQPITAGVSLGLNPATNDLYVYFGTGRYISTGDPGDTSEQTWYGLIDGATAISNRSSLTQRTIASQQTVNSQLVRVVSQAVDGDMNNKRGWYLDLVYNNAALGERMILTPQMIGLAMVGATLIPDTDVCTPSGKGFLMAVDPFTGAGLPDNFFDVNDDGAFNNSDMVPVGDGMAAVSGLGFGAIPSNPIRVGDLLITGLSDTTTQAILTHDTVRRGRLSWQELLEE